MSDCLADIDVAILCGGKGTRLKPIIGDLPKVLAPIKGRPFIEWHIEYLRLFGARNIILLGGHGWDDVRRWLDQYRDSGGIVLWHEQGGCGAALLGAHESFKSYRTLITNGDTLLKGRLCDVLYHMQAHYPAVLTVGGQSTGVILTSAGLIKEKYFVAFPMEAFCDFSFLDIGTPEGYAKADAFLE